MQQLEPIMCSNGWQLGTKCRKCCAAVNIGAINQHYGATLTMAQQNQRASSEAVLASDCCSTSCVVKRLAACNIINGQALCHMCNACMRHPVEGVAKQACSWGINQQKACWNRVAYGTRHFASSGALGLSSNLFDTKCCTICHTALPFSQQLA